MKGFQNSRTKAQNLTEISFKQGGFLTGLNLDSPKSEVGDTQLTVAKNVIPYRDRLEARGGLKPLIEYLRDGETTPPVLSVSNFDSLPMYDNDWDEFFYLYYDDIDVVSKLNNFGKKGASTANVYGASGIFGLRAVYNYTKLKNGMFFTAEGIGKGFIEYNETNNEYFYRPVGDYNSITVFSTLYFATASAPKYKYGYKQVFVRKVNGSVVAESKENAVIVADFDQEHNGTTYVSMSGSTGRPSYYFDPSFTGNNNYYTHIRYYRSLVFDISATLNDVRYSTHYYVGDYELNSIPSVPLGTGGPALDLNSPDIQLSSDPSRPVFWQDGYIEIPESVIFVASTGFFLSRNENKKNEFIYCPVGSGDNQKYFGWYNPLFQYGSVDGEITQMIDMGSYVVITTRTKTYYVDTVNYSEDEGQRSSGIFTPILPSTVKISDYIGVSFNQRNAFISSANGKAIAITSSGEIREFQGYQWGADLALNKVHSITKGNISKNDLYCSGVFVNDTYYLGYSVGSSTSGGDGVKTLRLGTTEESGFGFSEFEGNGWNPYSVITSSDVTTRLDYFYNVNGKLCIPILNEGSGYLYTSMHEYTGDKFDKKITKDVIDLYSNTTTLDSTTYHDIVAQVEFPEMVASREYYFLYFLKAHFYLRADRYSYKVNNEALAGYQITDNNLTIVSLDDIKFGLDARIGESDSIVASNTGFNHDSGVILSREVQDHRVRITLNSDSAGFQLTGMEAHFKRHDRTQLDQTELEVYIQSLNSNMYAHIVRLENKCVSFNRGSTFDIGTPIEGALTESNPNAIISGTYPLFISSPTNEIDALFLDTDSVMEFQLPYVQIPTKATVMFWERAFISDIKVGYTNDRSDFYSFKGRNTALWEHTAIVYNGSSFLTYHNGVLNSTVAGSLEYYVKTMSLILNGFGALYDIRMYDKELSVDEILFYANNIVSNNGDYFNGY